MLLAIDIGNTTIAIGIFHNLDLIVSWRIGTRDTLTHDEFQVLLSGLFSNKGLSYKDIKGVIISCVVPPLSETMRRFCQLYIKQAPIHVQPSLLSDMQILVDDPKSVGVDRLVNAVAAFHRVNSSVIVIDLGTATTIDCVSESGAFLGGVIAPGIHISADALFNKTAQLPRLREFYPPHTVIGKNTLSAINAGVIYGYASLVDGIVRRAMKEMQEKPRVIATGGLAYLIKETSETIESIDPNLNLEGLAVIYGTLY
ncbi:MAG: type III pantothenate kinase [Pseudomonadota bacterium]